MGGGAPASFTPGNPYESSYAPSRSRSAGHENKPKRSGLPWDRKDESAFGATVKMVLFSPTQAFYKMHRTGGLGSPLQFCITGILLGTTATFAYAFLIQLVLFLLILLRAGGDAPTGKIMAGMAITLGIYAVGALIALIIYAIVGVVTAFVNGGLLHLFLMAFGGANHSFETTFRVVCYSIGATSMYQIIPICGGLSAPIAYLVALIIGLYAGHETSGVKATFSVLTLIVVMMILYGLFYFAMASFLPHPAPPPGSLT